MAHWVSVWGQAHTDIGALPPRCEDRTCLLTVRSALDGERVRLRLSNGEGRRPMVLIGATVSADGGPLVRVRFGGKEGAVLAPGQELTCDEVDLPVRPGTYLQIRMAFRGPVSSGNCIRADALCSVPGDFTAGGQFGVEPGQGGAPVPALAAVEVLAPDDAGALVCFGDSITQMGLWTGPLEAKLLRLRPGRLALINKGIGGNRLLHGPASPETSHYGRAGMERFERDVLREAGAAAVIVAIGTNDFGHVADPARPDWVSAGMLETAFSQLAARARGHGLAVYGATVPPCMGCEGFGPAQEAERAAFDRWVRAGEGTVFDRVLDFDAVLRDPYGPDRMDMLWDSGDHLHPGPMGGLRMAEEALQKLL